MTQIIAAFTDVFSAVGGWITTALSDLVPIFYADGALTFLGTLSIMGLGISMVFLLVGIIQRFMHLAG